MTVKEEKSLKFLRNITKQLYKFDYSDVKPSLIDYVKSLPIPIMINERFPTFNRGGFYRDPKLLYRSCENSTRIETRATMTLPWKDVGRISHAPIDRQTEYIKEYGRANLPGEARFYCSNYYPAACIECLTSGFVKGINESKTVTMGTWKVNEPLALAQIAFSPQKLHELKHFNPSLYEERIKFTKDWYTHALTEFEKDPTTDCSIDYTKELLEFFSDEFGKTNIDSGRDYILSNYYAECVFKQVYLDNPTTIDGIIYPSVKYSYQEYNIVLHPRAMSKISFLNASQIWMTYDKQTMQMNCTPLETCGSDKLGNLQWERFKY